MRTNDFRATLKRAARVAGILLSGAVLGFGQQQINLSAGPSTATLPDGTAVPMWGYTCGAAVGGSTATCAALKAATGWSPVVIKVPFGQDLQINLTNNLPSPVPTSLVIVGQLGGGLGTTAKSMPSPPHAVQQTTWPIVAAGPTNTPPTQGPRVQSFATEVTTGNTAQLKWTAPRAGTYLIESGTHPSIQGPMGLYGILVVTTAPSGTTAGTAYPGVSYDADVPLLLSEIDAVQNIAVQTAVTTTGFSETAPWTGPGCACYPPAVNYTPLYYLINGVAFDKTNAAASKFSASIASPPPSGTTRGLVLVRLVNAGLRMHVPSIVGSQTGTANANGFSLIAEDGNPLPGLARVQSEVFLAAGKTYDVMINGPASATAPALAVFDRQGSLSGNATARDAGMLAYISINGSQLPAAPVLAAAVANGDSYAVVPGQTLTVSDPAKGVIANDVNVYGVKMSTAPAHGTLNLAANGTFTYVPNSTWTNATTDSFKYQANGTGPIATVALSAAPVELPSGIVVNNITYTAETSTYLNMPPPGPLSVDKDNAGYPLKVAVSTVTPSGVQVVMQPNGGFLATAPGAGTYQFTYQAQNSQGTLSAAATVTLIFPNPSKLAVTVKDAKTGTVVSDYRWIIEEDRTFYINPNCTTNNGTGPPPPGCPALVPGGTVPTFGVNFHTSFMPMVAQGCTGPLSCESGQTVLGVPSVCDVGNGACRPGSQETAVNPGNVVLDPTKRYYISVLPGDAANPFNTGNASPGHGMSGAQIAAACPVATAVCTPSWAPVTVLVQSTPFPTAKLSVVVFEDDFPVNGEQDAGGGIDILSPNEPGLGGFNIQLFDDAGGTGDPTGQMTYDMFNMPLSNSLAGTTDPATGLDACPISAQATTDPNQKGITGMIVTCPKYEADGKTLSPLAGQAVVANLMPGRYGVVATPGADRIARGEEWLQTNTLDGQKAHDSFLRIGEPSYFQEFGPAGYHVSIGFANPRIINDRLAQVCAGAFGTVGACNNTIKGRVTGIRLSRTPDERLYGSGSRDALAFTQCYVSLGDPDEEDFMFTKCNADGTFQFTGVPGGNWRLTLFDQWNDQIVDGLSTPANVTGGQTFDMGDIGVQQWQANIYTSTFFDQNGNGVRDANESGLSLVATNIRFRDGSFSNFNSTDLSGNAGFNEVFPLFNWYVVEADTTRYKNTGTHVVYDAGGPADGSAACTAAGSGCGNSQIAQFLANTYERVPLPPELSVPGAVYCATADCTGASIANGPVPSSTTNHSTGRIDPPWVVTEGWQGFTGQNSFLEFGKKPYNVGETGGIKGHVVYASTRPFDDPQLLLQTSWAPLVPNVTINLYQEGTAPDGTQSLKLVDSTKTSSWDDWAQGFRSDNQPNMNCPGQLPGPTNTSAGDLFFYTLYNQPDYLDLYNSQHNGTTLHTLPYNSQYKCYDGMHNWNQLEPAPYDGLYHFPSVTSLDPTTGKPAGTNCHISTGAEPWGCVPNPSSSNPSDPTYDPYRAGAPMLPAGKYVVEVVVPPGYELVKEEDKNILIGDNYIAPVTQQFGGLGSIFILPDQASVAKEYNANNAQNPTQNLGRAENLPSHEGDTGSVETFWPCVGQSRTVPDYISLFPQSKEVSPFAGATRNLCDRKEVTLTDQTQALAKFYIFTSTHAAAHYTGVITDDMTSEFDPFSPAFGEKFAPPNMPVSVKDYTGNEISRTYSDAFGYYDGLNYSTWEVNPPNPTGYAPTMMVTCMNDAGPIPDPAHPGQMMTDPLYNPAYSQFCYEIPFMPGQTQYMDTPVVPTEGFAGGYNFPDCTYPDATPAIKSVTSSDVAGPWVRGTGSTITITALGDVTIPNAGYSGPSANTAPFNAKTISRHYGFGTAAGTVTVGGVPLTNVIWGDATITGTVNLTGTVNGNPISVPQCAVQQQAQFGGSAAYCGQLVITAANGKQSVDTVTVTIGGKAPKVLAAGQTIQSALDQAAPGDLILVPPGTYNEMLLMWKPVRLQGVGAASSIINANTQPAGKLLDPWRRQVDCLFGMALNGQPYTSGNGTNPYDPTGTYTCPGTGWNYFNATPNDPQVDRLPLEAIIGWDATQNGNLAELLQEPTLMGAYEGAGITVLGRGVDYHGANPWSDGTELGAYPPGTTLLTAANCTGSRAANLFPSSFQCNPSSIDGLAITNSSQGGGGIFVHGWAHNLQIANNRVYNNTGTLSGGISVGQGEFAPAYFQGSTTNAAPGSCQSSPVNGQQLPYCLDLNVSVHNNAVTGNSSIGDELFSATLAGAGGVTFCTGADYYKFDYNWICGNLSSGEGGGVVHLGYIWNGDIEHNSILFNQSTNPTIPTNGGGLMVQGTPDTDPVCGTQPDVDCPPGLSDGTGPGLVINANLIQGNSADSGSGGGLRLQSINGTEVSTFPRHPEYWNSATVTNNIIVDNVAGWDGAGVSLQDALAVKMVNNTIAHNDSTATSGVLNNSLGAPNSSSPGGNCTANGGTASCPQAAGLVSMPNTSLLTTTFTGLTITCPPGSPNCTGFSNPVLYNNVIWQNRAFYIGVGGLGSGTQNQQKTVTLYNAFTTTPAVTQTFTGMCPAGSSYWDLGVRGDTGPAPNSGSGFALNPQYSLLTVATGYGSTNRGADPLVVSQYCNGSRIPPECTVQDGCVSGAGWAVPPGIADSVVPNPVFSLTPAATVDEGNNWINLTWGPLSLTNPALTGADGNYGGGAPLGNYAPGGGSPAIDYIALGSAGAAQAPRSDFFGNIRPAGNGFDAGAVEVQAVVPAPTLTSIAPNTGLRGTAVNVTLTGTNLTGATSVNVSGAGITVSNLNVVSSTTVTATFTIAAGAATTGRNVSVTTPGGTSNTVTFTVTAPPAPRLTSINPTSGGRGTSVNITLTGTALTGTSAVNVSGNGITVSNLTVVSDTTVTATFTISGTATANGRNVSVTTPGGTSNNVTFTVTAPPAPRLTTINPTSGMRGRSVGVTLTGTNLTGATSVNVSGGGIAVTNLTVVNSTTVTATFNIVGTATLGARNVSVTTPGGTSNAVTFTVVNPPAPVLATISPTSGLHNTNVNITLTGTNLTATSRINVSGTGITVSNLTVVNDTSVTATFAIANGAARTARTVSATTPGGTSNTVTFTVN